MFQPYELFYMVNQLIYICIIKVFKDITIIPKWNRGLQLTQKQFKKNRGCKYGKVF